MTDKLVYVVGTEDHDEAALKDLLAKHGEIKFVSLAGVDIVGHETDERIPIKSFIEDMDAFLHGIAVQTDGSSVYLPNIASLDNAKLDMKVDLGRNWFVDYNYENIDEETNLPIGTLKIPCFLYHEDIPVCARHILLAATEYFSTKAKELMEDSKSFRRDFAFDTSEIAEVQLTAATELEFWVSTPNDHRDSLELSTSQELHEQYWSSTRGAVRTALEQALIRMERYGLEPEMGHKEVGGVRSRLNHDGSLSGIMEQLEIDWKYTSALQAADNELLVKKIIKEVFRSHGMDVTFLAKPFVGVAGSGEHTHTGVTAQLKNGSIVNLFSSLEDSYLSVIGYGALMGILKNYEVVNPFVTSSNEAFKRLKKGFEAPICTVTSIGRSVDTPSRNRTVLIGLIRDIDNPLATRFELRAPNPHTNTFLALTTIFLAMLDGIEYTLASNKTEAELLKELSKAPGDEADYLEKDRSYRSEKDIFDDYTDAQREEYFGNVPETVYENVQSLDKYPSKTAILTNGEVISEAVLTSFKTATLSKWVTELEYKIIPDLLTEILSMKPIHEDEADVSDFDLANWEAINGLRIEIAKDTNEQLSLFSQVKEAIYEENYEEASDLQKSVYLKMDKLRNLFNLYKNNMIG